MADYVRVNDAQELKEAVENGATMIELNNQAVIDAVKDFKGAIERAKPWAIGTMIALIFSTGFVGPLVVGVGATAYFGSDCIKIFVTVGKDAALKIHAKYVLNNTSDGQYFLEATM